MQAGRRGPWSPLEVGCAVTMAAMLGCGGLLSGVEAVWRGSEAPAVLALAVAVATLYVVPHVALIVWLDRHEREPWPLLAGTFAWGALGATAIGGLVNGLTHAFLEAASGNPSLARAVTMTLSAPLSEEPAKALALATVLVLFRRHFDGVLDGLVYGAIVGLGFAWFEDIVYAVNAAEHGPDHVLFTMWARGLSTSAGSHATFTAMTGAGLGLYRVLGDHPLRALAPLGGLALAITAHMAWNALSGVFIDGDDLLTSAVVGVPAAIVTLQGPFLALVVVVMLLAWRHEDDLIRLTLEDEEPPWVELGDVAQLVPARRRTLRSAQVLLERGPRGWWWHRELTEGLIDLAFARWRHRADRPPWTLDQDPEVAAHRARVARARARGAST